jgi:hypothetical protein
MGRRTVHKKMHVLLFFIFFFTISLETPREGSLYHTLPEGD